MFDVTISVDETNTVRIHKDHLCEGVVIDGLTFLVRDFSAPIGQEKSLEWRGDSAAVGALFRSICKP